MPREPVRWFSRQMEDRLRQNDHKGGWDRCSLDHLMQRLRDEMIELEKAVDYYVGTDCDGPQLNVIMETCDVGNFAMMIADKMRPEDDPSRDDDGPFCPECGDPMADGDVSCGDCVDWNPRTVQKDQEGS